MIVETSKEEVAKKNIGSLNILKEYTTGEACTNACSYCCRSEMHNPLRVSIDASGGLSIDDMQQSDGDSMLFFKPEQANDLVAILVRNFPELARKIVGEAKA